jgi:hypothetical protein
MIFSCSRQAPAVAFLSTAAFVVLGLWHTNARFLTWDEVDYVNAARLGLGANYVESGSLSAMEFVAFARSKRAGGTVLPSGYEEQRDPLLLRHYHPPLGFYLLVPLANAENERVIRLGQLLGGLLLAILILGAYAKISPAATAGGFASVAALTLWATIPLFQSLSPHGWAALWCVLVPWLLSRWLRGEGRRPGLFLAAALGASLATQMPSPVLWGATLLALLIWRHPALGGRDLTWRRLIGGTALALAVAFLFWPGGVLKISLLKIPALQLYRLHLGQEFSSVSSRAGESMRFLAPAIVTVIPAAVWLCARHRHDARRWGPFLVIGVGYAAALLKFMLTPVYVLPAVCSLIPLVGYAIDRMPRLRHQGIVAAGAVALPLIAVAGMVLMPVEAQERADIGWLRTELAGRDTLADGAHVLRHYLGLPYRIAPLHVDYGDTSLRVRRAGAYWPLDTSDISGRTLVILKRRTAFFGSAVERALLVRCTKQERPTLATYRCP